MAYKNGYGRSKRDVPCSKLNPFHEFGRLTAKMLKHAGLLEPQDPGVLPFDETIDLDLRWKEWLRREHNNRYARSPFPRHFGRCWSYIIHNLYSPSLCA